MMYLKELPKIEANERLKRFEDILMTNEYIKDNIRQDYINRLQQEEQEIQEAPKDNKKALEMKKLQLQLMGIGIKDG